MHLRAWLVVVACALTVAACGDAAQSAAPSSSLPARTSTTSEAPSSSPSPLPPSSSVPTTTVVPSPTVVTTEAKAEDCPLPASGFDCDLQRRIGAVKRYVASRPGSVGVVVRDRQTGAVWRNEHAGDLVWTASTIKLAMAVDLLRRDHAGGISLTGEDHALITAMLHDSDDDAADALWSRYAGADRRVFNAAFPAYGLTSLVPANPSSPYWGLQKCTTDDLDRLIGYVLSNLSAEDRSYVVGQMRAVGPDQQWGVWGAGPSASPGTKDGWSEEDTGWVVNTVGFVGPGERYTVAVMNDLAGEGGYDEGRATDTEVARILFADRF
ncbi:tat pathway signal sequence [Actinosynnema sp. NPDC047251]|uniref:tat pathway signal sequence n=1 Tax=Saccharothrix espanaensis TaxID=103731 RepID=UPI001E4ABEC2|nr:tat pathway signal sequence [Saccharothrix espanaensis]